MAKVKYTRTAVILVQLAADDPNAVNARVLGVKDREVFNALRRFTVLRQMEFDAATRAFLKKARKAGRRLNLNEDFPGHLPPADCGND